MRPFAETNEGGASTPNGEGRLPDPRLDPLSLGEGGRQELDSGLLSDIEKMDRAIEMMLESAAYEKRLSDAVRKYEILSRYSLGLEASIYDVYMDAMNFARDARKGERDTFYRDLEYYFMCASARVSSKDFPMKVACFDGIGIAIYDAIKGGVQMIDAGLEAAGLPDALLERLLIRTTPDQPASQPGGYGAAERGWNRRYQRPR